MRDRRKSHRLNVLRRPSLNACNRGSCAGQNGDDGEESKFTTGQKKRTVLFERVGGHFGNWSRRNGRARASFLCVADALFPQDRESPVLFKKPMMSWRFVLRRLTSGSWAAQELITPCTISREYLYKRLLQYKVNFSLHSKVSKIYSHFVFSYQLLLHFRYSWSCGLGPQRSSKKNVMKLKILQTGREHECGACLCDERGPIRLTQGVEALCEEGGHSKDSRRGSQTASKQPNLIWEYFDHGVWQGRPSRSGGDSDWAERKAPPAECVGFVVWQSRQALGGKRLVVKSEEGLVSFFFRMLWCVPHLTPGAKQWGAQLCSELRDWMLCSIAAFADVWLFLWSSSGGDIRHGRGLLGHFQQHSPAFASQPGFQLSLV